MLMGEEGAKNSEVEKPKSKHSMEELLEEVEGIAKMEIGRLGFLTRR